MPVGATKATCGPRKSWVAIALALVLGLTACSEGGSSARATVTATPTPPVVTVRILAADELADMVPLVAEAERDIGVRVEFEWTGTRTGTNAVLDGGAAGHYDAAWFATDRYLRMAPGGNTKVDSSTPMMSSPVILGLRGSVVRRLGWDSRAVGWPDIVAASGKFGFGMSDPVDSDAGLSALVALATSVAGNGAALQVASVEQAAAKLREFRTAQTMQEPTGELLESFVRDQATSAADETTVDGLVGYESTLLTFNASGQLHDPLVLIYPADGVVTADFPLSVLASAPAEAKTALGRLAGYLRTAIVQRRIMDKTRRRPIVPEVRPDSEFGEHQTLELPFPGSPDVVNAVLATYRTRG